MPHVFPARTRGAAFTALSLLLLLAACSDDPSLLETDLGDELGGDPQVTALTAMDFDTLATVGVTGGRARILAGLVDDPLFSRLRAGGALRIGTSRDRPDAFVEDGATTSTAYLELVSDYVYGDTSDAITLNLRTLTDTWSGGSLRADTMLAVSEGDPLTSFSFVPTTDTFRVELPEDWITENDSLLRSGNIAGGFDGFWLEPADDADALVGFNGTTSSLVVVAASDTATYGVSDTFSSVEQLRAPPVEEFTDQGLYPLQHGRGPALRFRFEMEDVLAQTAALNDAVVLAYADTLALADPPVDFVRPRAERLGLYGLLPDADLDHSTPDASDDPVPIVTATLDENGRYVFDQALLRVRLQAQLLGDTEGFTGYYLGPPFTLTSTGGVQFDNVTVNPIAIVAQPELVPTPPEAALAPQLVLTLTEVNE